MLPLHQSSTRPVYSIAQVNWWGRRDSNSHTSRRWNLNPVRLPISPRPHQGTNLALDFSNFGRGSRTRTLTNGFGDRHATITPILYSASLLNCSSKLVGTERLELSHLAALEPKSSASTNFATSPMAVYIIEIDRH